MNPSIDPANELTFINVVPRSQTTNTGGFLCDVEGQNFIGKLGINVSLGAKTAGDSDMAISVRVMSSTTNNISNASNFTPATGSATVNSSNNATTSGQISVDPRAIPGRYLFWAPTLTGTNSPAVPTSLTIVATKKVA